MNSSDARKREEEEYHINFNIFAEIEEIIFEQPKDESLLKALDQIRTSEVTSEVERKRIQARVTRPNQTAFRKDVLQACERCVITNVMMPEMLEAAHIKPFKIMVRIQWQMDLQCELTSIPCLIQDTFAFHQMAT